MYTLSETIDALRPVKTTSVQQMRLLKFQKAVEELATEMHDLIPQSPDLTVALRRLLEVKWIGTQAITHNKDLRSEKPEEITKQAAPQIDTSQEKGDVELATEAFTAGQEKSAGKGKNRQG